VYTLLQQQHEALLQVRDMTTLLYADLL
jgi:hypothetical protein